METVEGIGREVVSVVQKFSVKFYHNSLGYRGSGWGTRVYPWRTHVDVRQNQYNIVISLQLK